MDEIRFLALCGLLGYGYPQESLARGMETSPHFIAVDAGSTDPGPYYLGSGESFVQEIQVRRDLEPALLAARSHGIPLIVGTAGGSGAAPHVNRFVHMLRDLATTHNLHFRLAVIPADVSPGLVHTRLRQGRIRPCGPSGDLTPDALDGSENLVAQMGTEPIVRALEGGADVIIAGRCCDAGIFAAFPILAGFPPGLALHCGKIAECGALCATPAGANDALLAAVRRDRFTVEPANPSRRCTPESVMAHSLYEQPNPDCFFEPEGKVDLTGSVFEQTEDRAVTVSGTRLEPAEVLSIKLEGATLVGYRSVAIAGIRDPLAIRNLDTIEQAVRKSVIASLDAAVPQDSVTLRFIRYGLDGVTGLADPDRNELPREVGLIIEAVGPDQQTADAVLGLARATALHQAYPGRKTTAGNLAFPFSPSDLSAGPVYEFSVYHLMELDPGDDLFKITWIET